MQYICIIIISYKAIQRDFPVCRARAIRYYTCKDFFSCFSGKHFTTLIVYT